MSTVHCTLYTEQCRMYIGVEWALLQRLHWLGRFHCDTWPVKAGRHLNGCQPNAQTEHYKQCAQRTELYSSKQTIRSDCSMYINMYIQQWRKYYKPAKKLKQENIWTGWASDDAKAQFRFSTVQYHYIVQCTQCSMYCTAKKGRQQIIGDGKKKSNEDNIWAGRGCEPYIYIYSNVQFWADCKIRHNLVQYIV